MGTGVLPTNQQINSLTCEEQIDGQTDRPMMCAVCDMCLPADTDDMIM